MNATSERGIIYHSQKHPAWQNALDKYEEGVKSAKGSVKAMKAPGSQIGYNSENGQFGIGFLNAFMCAKTDAEFRSVELSIISSKIQFLLKEVAEEMHRAVESIDREALAKHLIDKASDLTDFEPQGITYLFQKIKEGSVNSDAKKTESHVHPAAVASCSKGVNESVETVKNDKGKAVRAKREIAEGELVIKGWGESSPIRTMHTIQVDGNAHLVPVEPFVWLNHSCKPNCGLLIHPDSLELYALRPIKSGEEITVDYATFEWQIDFMPEKCLCGNKECRGSITGYKDLPDDLRKSYGKYIAPFLVNYIAK